MQAELKLKEKGTEQFENIFTEKVQTIKEIERIIIIKIQKDLETKLIAELQEKFQLRQLEKKVVEEEETKKVLKETELQEEKFCEYGIETESFYHKDKGAYSVKQPYEQDHGEVQK